MAIPLSAFLATVDNILFADNAEMSASAREDAIRSALEQFNRDVSPNKSANIAGNGGKYYLLYPSGLDGWIENESRVLQVEYPAADIGNNESPNLLTEDEWDDKYKVDDGGTQKTYLFFPNHSPTETIRVIYYVPYVFSGNPEETDLSINYFYALCLLAASKICCSLSARYARVGESTMIDSSNHLSKSQQFQSLCKQYREEYEDAVGVGKSAEKSDGPAGKFVDWDNVPNFGGRRYVFH